MTKDTQYVSLSTIIDEVWIKKDGKGLGPVHRSTGPVEMLPRVQFLYTWQHLNGSSALVHWTQAVPKKDKPLIKNQSQPEQAEIYICSIFTNADDMIDHVLEISRISKTQILDKR